MATHFRIDSLFAGVFVSYLRYFRTSWFATLNCRWAPAIAVACCIPEIFLPSTSRFVQTIGLSLLYVGFAFLVAGGFQQRTPEGKLTSRIHHVIAGIGIYSYSIYLWHMPFGVVLQMMYPHSGSAFALYICLSLGVGILASRLIEIPFLRLRERLMNGQRYTSATRPEPEHETIWPWRVAD